MPTGHAMDKDTILGRPCDVLIPAAIGGVIDEDTAKDVQVGGCASAYVMQACRDSCSRSVAVLLPIVWRRFYPTFGGRCETALVHVSEPL